LKYKRLVNTNMNKRTSYNIPAVLVHEINGTEYRVNGKIVGINEAKSTVSMTFKGYRGVEHDIPMSAVLINEGIIDSLKNAGKKIVTGIKTLIKKVKGFLLPASEDGEVDYSFLNAPVNVAIMEDKGMLADSVHFYANDAIIETAADNGIELDNDVEPFDYTGAEEGAECEKYWARVMKEFVKNESLSYTVSDAIKDVNEKYYRVNNLYKQQALNEAMGVVSLENSGGHKDMYGSMIGTKLLVKEVIKNIKEQTERTIGAGPAQKPIMIWGAPGIGKTVILKEVVNTFKEQYRKNLMLIELSCSALQIDDWGLPTVDEREDLKKKYHELNIGNAKSIPQTWLPVYETTGDPDIDQRTDNIYNSGEFRKGVSGGFDGGVIFFDEYSRLPASSKNVMMTLTGSCMYGGMTLATGWSMIFASNRFQDVLHSEQAEFEYESAQTDRFQPFTYVPTRGEWLRWARMQNTVTGRQNIDEMFCQFIETQGDSVWYGALTTGAFENILDSNQNKTIEAYKTNPTRQGFNDLLAIINDESEGSAGETIRQSHLTVTPRTWQRGLNDSLFDELRLMIFDGHPKLYQSIFDEKGNLDPAALKKALNMLSPKEWHRWAEVYTADSPEEMNRGAICYTNQLDRYDRYVFFKDWLEQHFKNTFGEKAKATTAWHDYNEYAKVFTPKEMTSIWETGDFSTEELRKENNKYFSDPARYMQETTNCKWKTSDGLISEIIERIFDNFPGGI
jgi:MoxR-like ATPase